MKVISYSGTYLTHMQCLLSEAGGLKIVAVGSVMTKAWDLLQAGELQNISFSSSFHTSHSSMHALNHPRVHGSRKWWGGGVYPKEVERRRVLRYRGSGIGCQGCQPVPTTWLLLQHVSTLPIQTLQCGPVIWWRALFNSEYWSVCMCLITVISVHYFFSMHIHSTCIAVISTKCLCCSPLQYMLHVCSYGLSVAHARETTYVQWYWYKMYSIIN